MGKKSYVILDENNRWLSTGIDCSEKQLLDDVQDVKERLNSEDSEYSGKIFVYFIIGERLEFKLPY